MAHINSWSWFFIDGWTRCWLLTLDYHHTNNTMCAHIIRIHIKGNTWVDLFDVLDLMALYMKNWSTTSIQYDKLKTIENAYGIENWDTSVFIQIDDIRFTIIFHLKFKIWTEKKKNTEFAFFVCSNSYFFPFSWWPLNSSLGAKYLLSLFWINSARMVYSVEYIRHLSFIYSNQINEFIERAKKCNIIICVLAPG